MFFFTFSAIKFGVLCLGDDALCGVANRRRNDRRVVARVDATRYWTVERDAAIRRATPAARAIVDAFSAVLVLRARKRRRTERRIVHSVRLKLKTAKKKKDVELATRKKEKKRQTDNFFKKNNI